MYGPVARGYALQNAVAQVGGFFFLDADVELVN
jgi:hypothetical protein